MAIISRYIAGEIVKWFSLCFAGTMAIYLFVDFFEKTRHFAKHDANPVDIALYLLLRIPDISLQLIPFVLLMGTILGMVILYRNNEIIAMHSCGLSLSQVARPGIGFAFIIAVVFLALDGMVIPIFNEHAGNIRAVRIEHMNPAAWVKPRETWVQIGNQTLMNVKDMDRDGTTLQGVSLYRVDSSVGLMAITKANEAHYSREAWSLQDGIEYRMFPDGKIQQSGFETKNLVLAQTPEDFNIRGSLTSQELTFKDLKAHADRLQRNGHKFSDFLTDYHARMAFPFAGLILTSIGIMLSLRMGRVRGGGVTRLIGLSILIAVVYLAIHSLAVALGRGGVLMPLLAGWIANIMFLSLGGYLLLRVR